MQRDLVVKLLTKLKSLRTTVREAKQQAQIMTRSYPVIIEQPVNYKGSLGDTASFHVEAVNIASYLWQNKGTGNWLSPSLPGVQTDTLNAEITSARLKFLYRCKLTGIDGTVIYTDEVKMELEDA